MSPCGTHTVLFDFASQRSIDPPWTFQVHRAEFDAILLDHAKASGAKLVFGRARDYHRDADGVSIDFTDEAGLSETVRCKAVIDASGRTGLVARREGVRIVDQELRKAAVYAHFRNVPTEPGQRSGDTLLVSLPKLGWMWFIPLKNGIMSVGAVLDLSDYQTRTKGDPAAIFAESVAAAPAAARLLASAERIGEFSVESGFSYRARTYGGDRWLLAGDAGSFLDPVFSTGVLMALRGGIEAADAAVAAFVQPRGNREAVLRRFDTRLHRRYWFVRRFVMGFYDPHTRDIFFAPRPLFGMTRAVTKVLAGGFDPGLLDRLRLKLFFLVGRLQSRYDLVPRRCGVRVRPRNGAARMKRVAGSIALAFALVASSPGQTTVDAAVIARADKLLETHAAQSRKVQVLVADYVQRRTTELSKEPLVSRGEFLFVREPACVVFRATTPRVSVVRLQETIYEVYRPQKKQLERFHLEGPELAEALFAAIGGDLEVLRRNFAIQDCVEDPVAGRVSIRLAPRTALVKERLAQLIITVRSKDGILCAVAYRDSAGDLVEIELQEPRPNPPDAPSASFDVPKDTTIVEHAAPKKKD
jgi:2-polyprenyl-6-methoxyphenol hydroxylase-like FAD-dependent oxidoreductase